MNCDDYRERLDNRKTEMRLIHDLFIKGGSCIICGNNQDPRILELHHIAGRKNSDVTIPVCSNCHRTLSMGQEPRKFERGKDDKTDQEKLAWNLDDYALLFKLLSYNLQEQSQSLLGVDIDG
jgi:hypothetical protein